MNIERRVEKLETVAAVEQEAAFRAKCGVMFSRLTVAELLALEECYAQAETAGAFVLDCVPPDLMTALERAYDEH